MTNISDKIVTLVLVFGPKGPNAGTERRIAVTLSQAEELQTKFLTGTSSRAMCFWRDSEGALQGVDVGTESGLVELSII